jgi:hypothetical protein
MPKHKVGDRVLVKLSGGRIVEATVKALVDTTEGVRLQIGSRGALGRTGKKNSLNHWSACPRWRLALRRGAGTRAFLAYYTKLACSPCMTCMSHAPSQIAILYLENFFKWHASKPVQPL